MTGTGLCVIRASQPGSADFSPATPVTQAFAIMERVNAKALASHGKLGGVVALRYRFSAIGFVTTSVVVSGTAGRSRTSAARTARSKAGTCIRSRGGRQHASSGRFRFCVAARDRLQSRVAPSCAPIRLEPAAQPPLIAAITSTRERSSSGVSSAARSRST